MQQTSVFRSVAIGRVDSNREPGIDRDEVTGDVGKITVSSVEWHSMHDGERTSNPTQVTYKTTDVDGVETRGGFIADQVVEAVWLPAGTNRRTPPDVRRGERVEIFQVADEDKYYWRALGFDDHLRKLETVVFAISATRDEGDTTLRSDNTYWIEFSTHTKRLAFSSCKADGEPYVYECWFDLAKGEFHLADDIGNFVSMISKLSLIHLQNDKGTWVKLDKKDIKAYAPQNIVANAEKDVNITAGNNMTCVAKNTFTLNGGGSTLVAKAGNITLTSPTIDLNQG